MTKNTQQIIFLTFMFPFFKGESNFIKVKDDQN